MRRIECMRRKGGGGRTREESLRGREQEDVCLEGGQGGEWCRNGGVVVVGDGGEEWGVRGKGGRSWMCGWVVCSI